MTYDDTNKELRIRQRSQNQTLFAILAAVGACFAMLGLVMANLYPPVLLSALGAVLVFLGLYNAYSIEADNVARRIYKWRNSPEDVAPVIEYDKLKQSANTPRKATDGGEQ